MSNKIFKSMFFTSMLVLLSSFVMIFSVLFSYFERQVFSEMQNETKYIAYALQNDEVGDLNRFEGERKRITLIASDGTVLADSEADAGQLENHANRKEIQEALKNGHGRSERYSDTLTEKTLYYAEKLENGNVLRVSTTQNSVLIILLGLLQPVVLIVVIALTLSLFLSYRISNSIIRPVNNLDLEHPEQSNTYAELTPLLKKLAAQNKTISRQIQEAERSREEFKLICENMNEGFLVLDQHAGVLSFNTAALRLLEIDVTESVQNQNVLTLNRSKGFREVIEKALSGKRAENELLTGDNTYSLIANPVCRDEKNIGAVVVIIDITESAKREQLRREFTSNVSHELKTPLTSISGFAEMMKNGATPEKTVIDFAGSIYDEAQRLISLVSDIMKISELDEGVISYEHERVDLFALANRVAERLKPVCDKRHIAMHVIGDTTYITGVAKILDEMIYNLCDNAIQYNRENGTVDVILTSSPEAVKLMVRDSGIGISKADQARVFERFYRVDKSRSKSVGGTGLGLAIVKHGAMYHQAQVQLESTEGKGTTVTLVFKPAFSL